MGSNDWAYNHNRLIYPGQSKLKVRFQIPASMFRKLSPDCTFLMRTSYFAPWNMDPCTCSVTINDEKVLKTVQVLGENHGRTTHDSEIEDATDEEGEVEVFFDGGNGVLFMNYFEILVKPAQQEE